MKVFRIRPYQSRQSYNTYHDLKQTNQLYCCDHQERKVIRWAKDIIKVECPIEDLDLDILGFIDHNITVNIIKDEKIVEKKDPAVFPKKPGCKRDQM